MVIYDSKVPGEIKTKIIQDINSNKSELMNLGTLICYQIKTVSRIFFHRFCTVSMLAIIPQYLVITIAEILISVTGLEFAYTQAPRTMKSLVMSGWLLTNSIGNVVVMIVAESQLVKIQVFL